MRKLCDKYILMFNLNNASKANFTKIYRPVLSHVLPRYESPTKSLLALIYICIKKYLKKKLTQGFFKLSFCLTDFTWQLCTFLWIYFQSAECSKQCLENTTQNVNVYFVTDPWKETEIEQILKTLILSRIMLQLFPYWSLKKRSFLL